MSKISDLKHKAAKEAFEQACSGLIIMATSMVSETTKKEVKQLDLQNSVKAKLNKAMNAFVASLTPDEYNNGAVHKFLERGDYVIVEVFVGKGE